MGKPPFRLKIQGTFFVEGESAVLTKSSFLNLTVESDAVCAFEIAARRAGA